MALFQTLIRSLPWTVASLVSLTALTTDCDDPDESPSTDDTPVDSDAGGSQSSSSQPPLTTRVDIDAQPAPASTSYFSPPDAALDVAPSVVSSSAEAGGSMDATSSTAPESGVSVTAVHAGAADAAATATDAGADASSGPTLSSDAGPCGGGRTLCQNQCVDTSSDSQSCGACGHDCLGAPCTAGQCQPTVVASGLPDAVGLAVDGTNAYFSAGGVVYECAADGTSTSPTLLADSQDAVGAVAVDTTNVYWTTADSVMDCAISGCNDTPTALATNLANPWGIAVDATRVYWADFDDGTVAWLPLAGGAGVTIAGGTSPQYIAVDSQRIYFTDVGDGTNGDVAAWGGDTQAPVVLATGASPNGIATDGANVYWTAGSTPASGATVSACEVGGCNGTPDVLSSDSGTPQRIAVDGSGVYWANGDVYVLRTGSSTPVALTSGRLASDIALDDSYVYWIDIGATDAVMRVAK